jgi:hypothetical protein
MSLGDLFNRRPGDVRREQEQKKKEEQTEKKLEEFQEQIAALKNQKSGLKRTPKKDDSITIKQQLLLLHYLGALEKINKLTIASKKSVFLKQLLNKNEQNIRTEITPAKIEELLYSNSRRKREQIKENLIKVSELFDELGLKSVVKKVKQDIERVDQ